jgi:hypothetical protein
LFIYNNPLDGSYGGSQGTIKAKKGLGHHFELISYSCVKKSNKLVTFLNNCFLYSGNLNRKDCGNILKIIAENKKEIVGVYFDVSLHGRLAKKIKKRFPDLRIVINYHNNEKKFYADGVKKQGVIYFPVFLAAWYNEKLSLRYGGFHVFITKEDKETIGRFNGLSAIIPVTLPDTFERSAVITPSAKAYILFVGAALAFNVEGARFIIEKIAPYVPVKCVIAGKNMRSVFNGNYPLNVEIFDFVEDLGSLFCGASAFVSPLFNGSGAKVKIAEALMHGKKILGTPLSFYGYEKNENFVVCETAVDFIDNIKLLDMEKRFYKEARQLFCDKYSEKNLSDYYKPVKEFLTNGEMF